MEFSLFTLFANILAAAKVNDYKTALCNAGRLIALVTCQTVAQLLTNARPKLAKGDGDDAAEPAPLTPAELYNAAEHFVHELEADHHNNESIVRQGAASDDTIEPGEWAQLFAIVMKLLRKYIPRPLDWQPAPLAFAPPEEPKPVAPAPSLPTVARPSDLKKADEPPADKPTDATGEPEGDADEDEPEGKAEKPKAKKSKKP